MTRNRWALVALLFAVGIGLYLLNADPRLNTLNPGDTDFNAAERQLGEVQAEARLIVLRQPGVKAVKCELDRDWLLAHNIEVSTG